MPARKSGDIEWQELALFGLSIPATYNAILSQSHRWSSLFRVDPTRHHDDITFPPYAGCCCIKLRSFGSVIHRPVSMIAIGTTFQRGCACLPCQTQITYTFLLDISATWCCYEIGSFDYSSLIMQEGIICLRGLLPDLPVRPIPICPMNRLLRFQVSGQKPSYPVPVGPLLGTVLP